MGGKREALTIFLSGCLLGFALTVLGSFLLVAATECFQEHEQVGDR